MPVQFSDFYTSLDADPIKRGKQFERFAKWFLKADPEWATQVDQVWLWDEWPERWGADCGIDLVFRHKNGEHWAVQAKCYSPDYDITKHDVDKFLSESNRSSISKRLLIATTDRIGANAKQVCDGQEKPVVRYLLSNFESAEIEYPARFKDLYQAKPKECPTPRPHQDEAIAAVAENFTVADRGQLIMACGTGKTYTTLWIKEKLGSQRTLMLVPSLSLLSQTLKEWTFAATHPFDVLCVCSDQTVSKRGEDEAIHSVADLAFPVTSNVNEIRQFLQGEGDKVVFSTYQSSPLIAEAQTQQNILPFELVIADEAHRCAGKVGSDFATILNGDLIKANKRLFATATPRTYATAVHKAAEERGVEVVGMDDEAVFGKVFYSLPFPKAIQKGLLTDYRVVIIGVDDPTIADWITNRELIKSDEGIETDAESLAAQIGLLKAIKDYDLKRVISFHSRVKRAEEFASDIQDVLGWVSEQHKPGGNLWSDFVSGAMPTNRRKQKLDRLKAIGDDQRGILTNARCLSEGVDVPSLDGVAFIDPRSSQVDIVQAVGRAIRLSADKKYGTIVLPVFIKQGEDAAASIEASNFKPVWEILNALKSHDEELAFELDQLRTEMARRSGTKIGLDAFAKIAIDLPASIDATFGDSLRTYMVEQTTASWNFWFGLLQAFVEKEGHCSPSQQYATSSGYRLGSWVNTQRNTKDLLPEDRKVKLEALHRWNWSPRDSKWEAWFAELLAYKVFHGHADVPTDPSNKLWVWVRKQRQAGNNGLLSQDKFQRLENLGLVWNPRDEGWEERFNELLAYRAQYGDINVPDEWPTGLGAWVGKQRNLKRTNKLPQERLQRLNEVEFTWDANEARWEVRYSELLTYKENHGNIELPHDRTSELWRWVSTQRIFKKRGKLPEAKISRLDEIGFVWDVAEIQWKEKYNELLAYRIEHGHVNVRTQPPTPLGSWVNWQRIHYRNGKLSVEKLQRLNEIGFEWNPIKNRKRRLIT